MTEYTGYLIEQILQHTSLKEISDRQMGDGIPLSRLKSICFAIEDYISEPNLEKQLEYVAQWVQEEKGGQSDDVQMRQQLSFFDLVDRFSTDVLTKTGTDIVYHYKFLDVWHRAAVYVGEDLFVTCACAYWDFRFGEHRKDFSWKGVLGHDNYELNRILNKGFSDNHFHLMGSFPYFDLSWSSLMNSVVDKETLQKLDELDEHPRNIKTTYIKTDLEESYKVMHLKAALIRLYLYSELIEWISPEEQIVSLGDYRVDVYWLLENILVMESPQIILKNEDVSMKNSHSIREYIEKTCPDLKLCKTYPGFYYFFWKMYPDIPIEILPDQTELFSRENLSVICEYVERKYLPFSLADVCWMFTGKYYKIYRKEWRKQTKQIFEQWMSDDMQILAARNSIQRAIDIIHVGMETNGKDYMLREIPSWDDSRQEQFILYGERWFLYEMFYYRHDINGVNYSESEKLYQYFWMYLVIKNRLMRELNYCNDKLGFANFSAYQKRKTWFTTSFTVAELVRYAVEGAFDREQLNSLEIRITPGKSWKEDSQLIFLCDSAVHEFLEPQKMKKFYYVFHFRKRKDQEKNMKNNSLICRHERYRIELKREVNAILLMRKRNSNIASRLRGIDACSSEDGCRPEVFAVAFRVLKNDIMSCDQDEKRLPQLRLSYHVGEDNQDVLDGIRAIDEAIYFLGMGSGDRLGHATMLGVDPWEWYYKRHYKISIRQMDYLDNVVWLFEQIIRYKLSEVDDVLEYLKKEYCVYFEKIYQKALSEEYSNKKIDKDIHAYYASWELRGDDPRCYESGKYEVHRNSASVWGIYSVNKKVQNKTRMMDSAVTLYHAYHYSSMVYKEGNKPVTVEIPFHVIKGIQAVQRKMMDYIARHGISIETNPTSNLLIGGLRGYEHHPILSFYNKGLDDGTDKDMACAQIHVSINTDDAGVFSTSLRNEYSLMAKSLEQMADKEGNPYYRKDKVYDWLDNVRQMGNEQSFCYDDLKESDAI